MSEPVVTLAARRWYRFRMVFAAVDSVLEPSLTGCEVKLLAKDGIYLNEVPRDITTGYMGARRAPDPCQLARRDDPLARTLRTARGLADPLPADGALSTRVRARALSRRPRQSCRLGSPLLNSGHLRPLVKRRAPAQPTQPQAAR
jgi:hypothetical protein